MRRCHPPDDSTSPKYKLLCFKLENNLFCQIKNALAFNRDMCCHLVLCLRLLPFHSHLTSWKPFDKLEQIWLDEQSAKEKQNYSNFKSEHFHEIQLFLNFKTKIWLTCEWKGINRKQSTRWQHLSRLKASAFFSLQKKFSCYKTQQLILATGTAIWWVTEPHLKTFWDFFLV